MKSCECVADVLSKLRNDDRNLGSQDVNNFAQVMQRFSSVALGCLRSFCAQDSSHATLSASLPRSIARLSDDDLEFMVCLRQQKSRFIQQWMERRDDLHSTDSTSFLADKYRYFGSYLFDVIFDC